MEDEKKVSYVTKEEFMLQVGIIWMYIFLTLIATMWGDEGFRLLLASFSALMFVVYTLIIPMRSRRKRRGMG